MSSYEQCEEQQQHTFAIVPTRVINERTYVCDLLEPHELPTDDTNLQQTCISYVCNTNNDTNTNNNNANNNNACVYTSYDNTNVYNNNKQKSNNYTSVSSYASNGSVNQNEKTLFSIEPHLLLFPPPHHGRCIQNVLMLHNSSAKEMCVYKLKCEKPHAFVAKHNVGLMYANSSLELRVTLRAVDKESEFNDRKDKDTEERNNNNNNNNTDDANENNISYKEINENSIVHFRLEIKFFKKLPERFAKHLHFRKEHSDKDNSRNSSDDKDDNEEEDDEEDDIENNKILNERVNAREVWNYFASFDEHSSSTNHQQHHHHHFNEHYHEDEQEEEEQEGRERHRSSGITQCEVIDLKAFFDGFTKRPETSTIIELPADYPNGLHSYARSHHGNSTKEEHEKETEHKTSNANEDTNKNRKESTENAPMPSEPDQNKNINNKNVNTPDNKVNDINNNNTIANDDNKSMKTKDNNNNTIIDNKDADAPPSMLSASPTKRTKLEDGNSNDQLQQQQQQEQEKKAIPNASTAPSSLTNNPANNNNNNVNNNINKTEKDNTNVNKDDNISFDSKALPRSFEENKDKASTTATNVKSEAAASAPAPPTSAPANNTDNVEGATESLFELYPNDDKPTNRAEPTDVFNDTTDALTSDKKASEHAQDQLNDQQKHISFANYSNTLLQAPLSIDNLAASIRASTIYNKSVVLTNKMRPYANMLLICIGFICVLALLLPPPQEKQEQAKEKH